MAAFEEFLLAKLEGEQELIQNSISKLAAAGGKRVRPALVISTAHLGSYNRNKVWKTAAAVEILHMATLIHDDIIDESKLRRTEETIQSKYGKDTAVFTGDYLFSLTFDLLSNNGLEQELQNIVSIIKKICRGEVAQYQRRYETDITYREYLNFIKNKTGSLFKGCCTLGAELGGLSELKQKHLGRFGRYLGIAFQLTDDILDFIKDSKELGKVTNNDFTQGIYTLPILYVILETDRGAGLKQFLKAPEENKTEIKSLVADEGGLEYTSRLADRYIKKAKAELDILSSPYAELLKKFAAEVKERNF